MIAMLMDLDLEIGLKSLAFIGLILLGFRGIKII